LAVSRAPVHPKGSPICFAGLVRQQIEQSFHSKARWEANKLFEKPWLDELSIDGDELCEQYAETFGPVRGRPCQN